MHAQFFGQTTFGLAYYATVMFLSLVGLLSLLSLMGWLPAWKRVRWEAVVLGLGLPLAYDQWLHFQDPSLSWWYRAALPCLVITGFLGVISVFWHSGTEVTSRKRPIASWVLVLLLMELGWGSAVLHRLSLPEQRTHVNTVTPGTLVANSEYCGLTDAGNRLVLYHWSIDDKGFEEYKSWALQHVQGFIGEVIRREPPSMESDCHGWVFAAGKYVITGKQVTAILADNGYVRVTTPRPNDVVVYREASGQIVHTGLVRGMLNDGTVMVESKWGIDGVYLHASHAQPYSKKHEFYRSKRKRHMIQVVEHLESDS